MPVNTGTPTTTAGSTNCWFCTAAACCNLLLGKDTQHSRTVADYLQIDQTSDAFATEFVTGHGGIQHGMSIQEAVAAPQLDNDAAVEAQIRQMQRYVHKHTGYSSIVQRHDYHTLARLISLLSDSAVYAFYFGAVGFTGGHWICAAPVNGKPRFMDFQQDSAASPGATIGDSPTANGKAVEGKDAQNTILIGFRTN